MRNIFSEIKDDMDLSDINFPHGNLENWANQGVLLLNTALSVRQAKPNSHSLMWKYFTNEIIKHIAENSENVIFLLWGNHAKMCKKLIKTNMIDKKM